MGALEVMLTLRDEKAATRHPLEMVVWSNEEGVHYGKGLFGSRAAARGPDPGELEAKDEQGVALTEWLRRYGVNPARIAEARLDPKTIAAYLELHIEQGPYLHRRGIQIGVVEGIVGIDRYHVTWQGFANHAGTTPMDERKDALVAAARLVQAVREEVMARPGAPGRQRGLDAGIAGRAQRRAGPRPDAGRAARPSPRGRSTTWRRGSARGRRRSGAKPASPCRWSATPPTSPRPPTRACAT